MDENTNNILIYCEEIYKSADKQLAQRYEAIKEKVEQVCGAKL